MDTTATSDFQNRFKGKMEIMKKDGHIGVVERTNKPITKINMDRIGYNSGMSGVSVVTTQVPQHVDDSSMRMSMENSRKSNYR
jgi:hypothetical protein